jgi:hypothetical protein
VLESTLWSVLQPRRSSAGSALSPLVVGVAAEVAALPTKCRQIATAIADDLHHGPRSTVCQGDLAATALVSAAFSHCGGGRRWCGLAVLSLAL